MVQAPSWVVGIIMLTVFVLKTLWGTDLIATAIIYLPRSRLFFSGSLWLGAYFIISGFVIYGYIGYNLVHHPVSLLPILASVGVAAAGVCSGVAWYFLSREAEALKARDMERESL